MHHLQGQARVHVLRWVPGPTAQQVPCPQAQMLGDQQPQPDHVARDLVGQQVADVAFDGGRVCGFRPHCLFGALAVNRDGVAVGSIFEEFFFAGRMRRRCDQCFVC